MKESAKSDAFLNMVQCAAEICSNGWHQWIQRSNRSSYLIDVLTVDEGVSQIGRVFEYGATPSGDMLKRMAPVDSAHQIGLPTLLIDVLTVDEGVSRWRFKNRQVGHVVHYSSTTRPIPMLSESTSDYSNLGQKSPWTFIANPGKY